jgi:hypothetical protein
MRRVHKRHIRHHAGVFLCCEICARGRLRF